MNRRKFFGLVLGAGVGATLGEPKPGSITQEIVALKAKQQGEEVAKMVEILMDSMKKGIRDTIELRKLAELKKEASA